MPHSARPSRSPSRIPREPDSVLPDGQVGEEVTELLHEFVHAHAHGAHPVDETLVDDEATRLEVEDADKAALEFERLEIANRPWWRRPSAVW